MRALAAWAGGTKNVSAARLLARSAEGASHMWRIILATAGLLIVIAGVVWTLQGLGFIKGSVMTGVTLWVLVGPLVALGGVAVTMTGLRRS